jgi:hypothetical protein
MPPLETNDAIPITAEVEDEFLYDHNKIHNTVMKVAHTVKKVKWKISGFQKWGIAHLCG